MKKYSRIYKYEYGNYTFRFRYNFDDSVLEQVCKPKKSWLEKDADGFCILDKLDMKQYEETGYIVLDATGLSYDDWKEDKYYYMDVMSEDAACLMPDI